jgi:hypothetical protein
MRRDVLRRVRWGNVALAATVIAVLAAVVAWPRLASAPPALPPDTARPLVRDEPAGGEAPASNATKPRGRKVAPRRAAKRSHASGAGGKTAGGRTAGAKEAGRSKTGGKDARPRAGAKRGRAGEPVAAPADPRRAEVRTAPPRRAPVHSPPRRGRDPGGEFSFEGG